MFDSHVHAAPDVVDRRSADIALGRAYAADGFSGFVLKAHYESTVGRARAVADATGLTVHGGIALNQHTGGVNPAVVAASLAAGGRVVWMPTADAHTQARAGLPRLCDHEPRLSQRSYAVPPVDPQTQEAADLVLEMVAEHDAVLATGHLSGAECRWLSERASFFGITRLLFTHPSYTVPGLDPTAVRDLLDHGGFAEITAYQLLHQPGCTPGMLARVADAAGSALVLSSDVGQPDSPTAPEALRWLIDSLVNEGLDRSWLEDAASTTPASLFAPK